MPKKLDSKNSDATPDGMGPYEPGISFVVRVRNERDMLGRSLESLRALSIPHEVIVILHMCTDDSREIAESSGADRILRYDIATSRAGYETLVTDVSSRHSLMTYYNWCFAKAKHIWCFSWDADFVATPELIAFLNGRAWCDPAPSRIRIPAVTPNAKPNLGPYLFNAGRTYGKSLFWEYNISLFDPHVTEEVLSSVTIEHASPLEEPYIKPYWRLAPWFEDEDTAEAEVLRIRLQAVIDMFGPEPLGMARAANPVADQLFADVVSRRSDLEALGIGFWS